MKFLVSITLFALIAVAYANDTGEMTTQADTTEADTTQAIGETSATPEVSTSTANTDSTTETTTTEARNSASTSTDNMDSTTETTTTEAGNSESTITDSVTSPQVATTDAVTAGTIKSTDNASKPSVIVQPVHIEINSQQGYGAKPSNKGKHGHVKKHNNKKKCNSIVCSKNSKLDRKSCKCVCSQGFESSGTKCKPCDNVVKTCHPRVIKRKCPNKCKKGETLFVEHCKCKNKKNTHKAKPNKAPKKTNKKAKKNNKNHKKKKCTPVVCSPNSKLDNKSCKCVCKQGFEANGTKCKSCDRLKKTCHPRMIKKKCPRKCRKGERLYVENCICKKKTTNQHIN